MCGGGHVRSHDLWAGEQRTTCLEGLQLLPNRQGRDPSRICHVTSMGRGNEDNSRPGTSGAQEDFRNTWKRAAAASLTTEELHSHRHFQAHQTLDLNPPVQGLAVPGPSSLSRQELHVIHTAQVTPKASSPSHLHPLPQGHQGYSLQHI